MRISDWSSDVCSSDLILGGNMPLLKVDSITGGYGDSEILRQLSMSVDADEIVSIIGPNGAGKSTLMKTVFGLLHPRQGSITFRSEERRVGKGGVSTCRSRLSPDH